MKTAKDPRHQNRIHLMQQLFTWSVNPKSVTQDILPITNAISKINKKIEKGAPLWPIAKINKIDLAILRLSVYELSIDQKVNVPPKVIVDEAVELAKEFGGDTSPSFVNGVLGKLIDIEKIKT